MTDIPTKSQSSLPHHPDARPRNTIIAGYILSLEEGARWANKVRNDPTSIIPGDVTMSPTVFLIIDKDFREQGGIAVHYNFVDTRNEWGTTRYLVTTQVKQGLWWNNTQASFEGERVMDSDIRLEEGEADRSVLRRLNENGERRVGFGGRN